MKRTYTHPEGGTITVAFTVGLCVPDAELWATITYPDGSIQALQALVGRGILPNIHAALLAEGYTLQPKEA